ncbi:hypothetical protein [Campylobacter sp. 19-13652]|uniref:hypothetical protein n=1 Tax=Campylobacter sp. 19-13652 TaxID=2840180 RepID=UPI001C747B73|nr:hypothetical protein [Campylobacter sp. 19-13652]BCX79229.1 hypothetical protein LBC_06910 [Campylobacter sp. 19-13652]
MNRHDLKALATSEQEKRFFKLLEQYISRKDDTDPRYDVLDMAFDLFVFADNYVSATKAKHTQILRILNQIKEQ